MIFKVLMVIFSITITGTDAAEVDRYLLNLNPDEFLIQFEDYLEYNWSEEELKYAMFLVDTEAGPSMGEDGMMLVLGTPWVRFHSEKWCTYSWCSETLLDEMVRPGQYLSPEYYLGFKPAYNWEATERFLEDYEPSDTAILATYKFALGGRSSLADVSGYEYFNSIRGGPCQLRLEADNGLVLEFFSTKSFISLERQDEKYPGYTRAQRVLTRSI